MIPSERLSESIPSSVGDLELTIPSPQPDRSVQPDRVGRVHDLFRREWVVCAAAIVPVTWKWRCGWRDGGSGRKHSVEYLSRRPPRANHGAAASIGAPSAKAATEGVSEGLLRLNETAAECGPVSPRMAHAPLPMFLRKRTRVEIGVICQLFESGKSRSLQAITRSRIEMSV